MKSLLPLFILILAFSTKTFAAELMVNLTADGHDANTADGICDIDATTPGLQCTLRAAVEQANVLSSSDLITFNSLPSNSIITLTTTNGGEIPITNNGSLTINGLGANLLTINGGAGTNRIFYLNQADVTIKDVTLTGGNGTGSYFSGAVGGAILTLSGRLVLDRVHVTANSVTGDPNSNSVGGVYFNGGSNHQILNSTFSANTSSGSCGGFLSQTGITIINSTFSNNTTQESGGGFCLNGGSSTMRSVTVTANTASNGGGIVIFDGSVNLGNTIVAGNTGGVAPDIFRNAGKTITTVGYNLIGQNTGVEAIFPAGNPNGNNDIVGTPASPINSLLKPLGDNGGTNRIPTHDMLQSSPAFDKGNSFSLPSDQRGFVRPDDNPNITNAAGGDGSDIGAFEQQSSMTSGSISGSIRYGITEANQPQKFVAGVLLSATGTSSASANSGDATGAYTINGLMVGGNYTVTPTKIGEVKGINSLDATRIQQHRVGLITLTANQLIAADTDNNGTVNSLDATRIQQRLVGIQSSNIIGQWKFVPGSKHYNSVDGNLVSEDYQALLVGEVSGNWATASSFAGDSQTDEEILPKQDNQSDASAIGRFEDEVGEQINEIMKQSAHSKPSESKSQSAIVGGVAVNVSLPSNATASSGTTIIVPVTIGAVPTGSPIESFDFTVFYDPAVLQPAAPSGSNAGTLSANCSVLSNSPQSGRVVVSGACASAITTASGGVLYNLQFNVIGTSGQQTGLLFNNPSTGTQTFQFNSGTPAANTINGLFSVLPGPTAAGVSVSGKVTTASGRGIRNVLITMTDSQGNQRTAQTTAFGYYKFESVVAGESVTISAKARRFRFNQSSIVRTTNESVTNADFVSEQ
jgi:hypothetical protein